MGKSKHCLCLIFEKYYLDLDHCIIESVLTWTILIHIHSEKGNVTRSKMPDMKEMSPAMRPSHSCALSSVSQRLFGLSSMIGDNWLSKCPSFMALTAIKKKRNGFRQNGKMQYDWRLKLRGMKQMVLCGFSWYSSSLKSKTFFLKFFWKHILTFKNSSKKQVLLYRIVKIWHICNFWI